MAEQSFKIYKDTAERLDKNALDIASLKEDLGYIVKITETKSTNKLKFTDVEQQEKMV